MMMWKLATQAVGLARHRSLPKTRNLEILKSILINSAAHQVMDPLNVEVVIILTTRSPEVDPEVNLEADHLIHQVTGFTLATGLVPMTGVKIETTDQIMAHTIVMIATGTITVMTDIMMTDIMTSTTAGIMTGVTGLHIGVLLVDLQTTLGLMMTILMT